MSMEKKYPGWGSLPEWARWELARYALYRISDDYVGAILIAWLEPRLVYKSSWEYKLFLDWCSEHEAEPAAARLEDIVAERHPDVLRDDIHFLVFTRMYTLHPDHKLLRSDHDYSFREHRMTEMMMDRLPQDIRDRLARTVEYLLALCAIARCHQKDNGWIGFVRMHTKRRFCQSRRLQIRGRA